jgi:hypothetical protein
VREITNDVTVLEFGGCHVRRKEDEGILSTPKNWLSSILNKCYVSIKLREANMPTKRKNTGKKTSSGKRTSPSLKLVLNRLDKIDQRLETIEQNTAAEFKAVRGEMAQGREETAAEFKAVRGEMAQGQQETIVEFKAVRGEMTQGFDALRQDFKVELRHVSDAAYEHYLRIEGEAKARAEYYQQSLNNLQIGQDAAARDYDEYWRDRNLRKLAFDELQKDVEELKKRDMEKAAAIEKIQQEIDKSKAA